MLCIGSDPARAVARRIVLHEALRLRRTATSAEVWVMFGVEDVFGSSLDTFSAGSPMSCQDGTVKVRPPPASKLSRKSSRAATPLWMIAVFSIVNCWVYGVKMAGTITSLIWVDTLTMIISDGLWGGSFFKHLPMEVSWLMLMVPRLPCIGARSHCKFWREIIALNSGKQLVSSRAKTRPVFDRARFHP